MIEQKKSFTIFGQNVLSKCFFSTVTKAVANIINEPISLMEHIYYGIILFVVFLAIQCVH